MSEPFETGVFALSGELRQLGPYRLLGQLATGGMGVIYLGRDPATGRVAALKTLLAPGGVSAEARKRFDRETKLARRVTSTYTARVLDCDVEADRPWMAMEYVPAPSLEALVVQRGALADELALRWIGAGVVRALKELHGKGIVHRDVKPLNILLTADGPKVIDFGISHAGDLTSTRLTLGTVAFAAPEQADGEPSTAAADIYALGITLYYVACGRLPYPETQEPLQQLNYVRRAAIDLDGLPAGLTGLIGDCLAVRPDDRPTADQLIRRFGAGESPALPAGWSALIARHAEEGRRLQQAADQSEAETVTRGWTSDAPGRTRHVTDEAAGAGGAAGAAGARGRPSGRPGPSAGTPPNSGRRGGNPDASPGRGTGPSGGAGQGDRMSGKAAAGVAAVIGAVVLAAVLSSQNDATGTGTDSQSPPASSSAAWPTDDPDPTYDTDTDDEPADAEPADTGPADPDPEPDVTETEDDYEPTRKAPAPAPPTYTPPPDYYGAIAVGRDGSNGRAWDYKSRSAAEQGAMNRCSGSGCKILTSFRNGCGAVAYNRNTNHYWGAYAPTRAKAEAAAINRAGGGSTVAWVCTTRPR